MKQPSPATVLLLIAIAIPILLELRTVLGFLGIDVSLYGVAAVGLVYLVGLGVWVFLGEDRPDARST